MIAFILVWGSGVFFTFLAGIKQGKMPEIDSGKTQSDILKEQRQRMEDSKKEHEKMMRDTKLQIERFKNSRP